MWTQTRSIGETFVADMAGMRHSLYVCFSMVPHVNFLEFSFPANFAFPYSIRLFNHLQYLKIEFTVSLYFNLLTVFRMVFSIWAPYFTAIIAKLSLNSTQLNSTSTSTSIEGKVFVLLLTVLYKLTVPWLRCTILYWFALYYAVCCTVSYCWLYCTNWPYWG